MRTLYLHVGSPKAGSSSLQNFLSLNKSLLLSNNLFHYSFDEAGNLNLLAYLFSDHESLNWVNEIHDLADDKTKKDFKQKLKGKIVNEFNIQKDYDFIISSEHIFTISDNDENIRELSIFLSNYFDSIKIIVFLRDQLDYVLSSISQKINGKYLTNEQINFSDEISTLKNPQLCLDLYYDKTLRIFEKEFGRENIILKLFNKQNGKQAIFDDLLNIINLHNINFIYPDSVNQSSSLEANKYKIYLNSIIQKKNFYPNYKYINISDNQNLNDNVSDILNSLTNKSDKLRPSLSIVNLWKKEFSESNKQVIKRYNLTNQNELFEMNLEKISDSVFHNQFKIDIDMQMKKKISYLADLISSLGNINNNYQKIKNLVKPNYFGRVNILNCEGLYHDNWASKYIKIKYKSDSKIESLKINIYNPNESIGNIEVEVNNELSNFHVAKKNETLLIKSIKNNELNVLEIRSSLNNIDNDDSRDLSYVLVNLDFE